MLECYAEPRIRPGVERLKMQDINDAFDKRNDKEAGFRDVVDPVFRKDAQ